MSAQGRPMNTPAVLAVLDDAGAGATLLEISSTLARALRRELAVVYVENSRSLVAAALPITQVLGATGTQWRPLNPDEVEQGFRAQAARLREMAGRIALRNAVGWSLRVMRGSLGETAIRLSAEADLLLLANAPAPASPGFAAAPRLRRRPRVSVLTSGGEPAAQALRVATQVAQALAGDIEFVRIDPGARLVDQAGALAALARSDMLILARAPLDAATLAQLRCPVLLAG
jgi:peptidoglycan/xylan/chitin deacetylase (PgdA/CDA1 family)